MKEPVRPAHFEPRWPVALTIVLVIALLALLPERLQLLPVWVTYAVGIAVLVPIAGVGLTAAEARWLRIERAVTLFFVAAMTIATLVNLANLVGAIVSQASKVGGLQLLASSIAVWVNNVLMFSLLYWQMDRDGPEARVSHAGRRPDWLFPQEGAPAGTVPPGWQPVFLDYLYLGYSTATAFSTTEVMPLTSRAKMLMMLESTISLATIVVVASRAINILGS